MNYLYYRLQLIWKYAFGVLSLRASDIWFPSFPKAGSTWVRFFFFNLARLQDDAEAPIATLIDSDDVMPVLGHESLLREWAFGDFPRLIKTHQSYLPLIFGAPQRVVYLIRDPRDVMVSYFHYLQSRTWKPYVGDFSGFIRHPEFGLEAYFQHYQSWQSCITALLKYEDLKQDDIGRFTALLDELGIDVAQAMITKAAERASFKQMKELEAVHGIAGPARFKEDYQTVRKGKSSQWQDYFSDDDLAYLAERARYYQFDVYDVQ